MESNLTYKLVEVTPELAQEFLNSQNGTNRNLSPVQVSLYSGAMTRGEWMENGVPVLLDKDGRMRDGQHRMAAIIDSDTTQIMLVVGGLDPLVVTTIDVGKPRRMGDVLKMQGEKNVYVLGATINRAWVYETVGTWRRSGRMPPPTHQELLSFFRQRPEITDDIAWADAHRKLPMPRSTVAALRHLLERHARGHGRDFMEKFAETTPQATTNVGRLKATLLGYRRLPVGQRPQPETLAAVTIKAFNANLVGSKVGTLSWSRGKREKFPRIGNRDD